jgi:hypothetical protein
MAIITMTAIWTIMLTSQLGVARIKARRNRETAPRLPMPVPAGFAEAADSDDPEVGESPWASASARGRPESRSMTTERIPGPSASSVGPLAADVMLIPELGWSAIRSAPNRLDKVWLAILSFIQLNGAHRQWQEFDAPQVGTPSRQRFP